MSWATERRPALVATRQAYHWFNTGRSRPPYGPAASGGSSTAGISRRGEGNEVRATRVCSRSRQAGPIGYIVAAGVENPTVKV